MHVEAPAGADAADAADPVDVDAYCSRIGVDPDAVVDPT
jgi:hypothetical protein